MNAAVARHAGDLPAESELGDGGDRDGDVPVGGADAAVPERDGGGGHGGDPELAEGLARADDIGDRVQGTGLVEVDLLRVHAVDVPLGPREHRERGEGGVPRGGGDVGGLQVRADGAPGAVVRRVHDLDDDARGPLPAARHPLGAERDVGPDEVAHDVLDGGEVCPGVDAGSEQHVARHSGGDVQPRVSGHAPILPTAGSKCRNFWQLGG